MSCLIYLLILSIFPSWSASFPYGIIRNATIKLPFDVPIGDGYQSSFGNCENCLCETLNNSKIYLFTCTFTMINYTCQFYYFMPKLDEIYQSNDTDIYVITNSTFEEKEDCCNTTFLIDSIREANVIEHESGKWRFLVPVNHDTIISTKYMHVYKINPSNFTTISVPNLAGYKTVGYNDSRYYFGSENGKKIDVYNETLTSTIYTITSTINEIAAIRFLNKNRMLVGIKGGVCILEKPDNEKNFANCTFVPGIKDKQAHAIGIVDENAFYLGYYDADKNLTLYTKNESNLWAENQTGTINHHATTSDIFVDNCKRIWAVNPDQPKIFIYDHNETFTYEIKDPKIKPFGLLILENYTLVISSDSDSSPPGLYSINSSLNCRPSRKKTLFV